LAQLLCSRRIEESGVLTRLEGPEWMRLWERLRVEMPDAFRAAAPMAQNPEPPGWPLKPIRPATQPATQPTTQPN
jgi:hypothetical protein